MAPRPESALVAAYTVRFNRIRATVGTAVGQMWDRVAGLDDSDADAFAAAAARMALAGQAAAAAGVDGYLAAILSVLTGERTAPLGLPADVVTGAAARNGADPIEVYHRGVVTARTALAAGRSFDRAMAAGRQRMVGSAEMDVALAQRAATAEILSRRDVVGYRRVLTGRSCMFCATASTQRYRSGELMPLHDRCDCGVAPIVGDRDPGRVVNRDLLGELKRRGGSAHWKEHGFVEVDDDGGFVVQARGAGETRVLAVVTREHGELGPVLADAAHDFTGPGDLAA